MAIPSSCIEKQRGKFEKVVSINGQKVHYATDPNPDGRYVDDEGHPVQHDRACVYEVPELPPGEIENFLEHVANWADRAAEKGGPFGESGTTCTLVWYDPKEGEIHIRTKGDSPVYLLAHDKEELIPALISTRQGSVIDRKQQRSVVLKHVGDEKLWDKALGRRFAHLDEAPDDEWEFSVDESVGRVEVDHAPLKRVSRTQVVDDPLEGNGILKLPDKKAYCDMSEMDPATLVFSLAVGSDGFVHGEGESQRAPALAAVRLPSGNKAWAVIKQAFEEGTKDNCSVICLENIARGKGKPVMMVVCDGMGKRGRECAQTVISTVEERIIELCRRHGMDPTAQPVQGKGGCGSACSRRG